MKKILFLWLFLDFTLSANLIDTYQTTQFSKKPNTLYALQSIHTNIPDYQNKIRTEIFKEIASQIQVLVNTTTTSSTTLDHDVYTSHFHEHSVLVTKDIPLYKVKYIDEKIANGVYYVLASFNYKKALPLYIKEYKSLVAKINTLYSAYKNEKMLSNQETLLKKIVRTYKESEKYLFIVHFIVPNKTIQKPNVKLATVESTLDSLYDKDAKNIRDLATIIMKRLNLSKVHGSLKVEPISLRDGDLYSEFSYEFKSYLENAFKSVIDVSQSENTGYKSKGFYHLDSNTLVVDVTIVDKNNRVVSSAIAKMKIKDSDKLLKKYQPFKERGEQSEIINEYMQNW